MTTLRQPRSVALAALDERIAKGESLADPKLSRVMTDEPRAAWKDDLKRWRETTAEALRSLYGTGVEAREFAQAASAGPTLALTTAQAFSFDAEAAGSGVKHLRTLRERLAYADAPPEPPTNAVAEPVFVVHGRDVGLQSQVVHTVERLGLQTIVLAEEANQGYTLIEKLEAKSLPARYAVVILSPDDYGRGPEDKRTPTSPNRARQNVVLELGYFMGKLGRGHVCVLHAPEIQLPTDIDGLAYISLDDGGAWKFKLGHELKAASYPVDLNRLKL